MKGNTGPWLPRNQLLPYDVPRFLLYMDTSSQQLSTRLKFPTISASKSKSFLLYGYIVSTRSSGIIYAQQNARKGFPENVVGSSPVAINIVLARDMSSQPILPAGMALPEEMYWCGHCGAARRLRVEGEFASCSSCGKVLLELRGGDAAAPAAPRRRRRAEGGAAGRGNVDAGAGAGHGRGEISDAESRVDGA